MNNFFKFSGLCLLLIFLTAVVPAQKQPSKDELFQQIAKLTNTKKNEDQVKAYQMSKEFLEKFGKDTDDKVKKIRDYAVKFRFNEFNRALDEGRMDDALEYGKDILADEPENSYVTFNLAYGGFDAFTKKKDQGYTASSINYAKQTLTLFEAGKLPKEFKPFKDQAEVTALMYYIIGTLSTEFDPKEAALNFYKSLQYESQFKTQSFPYAMIADYYEKKYQELSDAYKKTHGGKTSEDAAMKADREVINKVVDQMMDVYARAFKFAEAENNPSKDYLKDRLKQLFVFRKGSDAGMNDFINSVQKTPLSEPK